MKDQRRGKEIQARLFSGHVAQATDVHEQVTKDAPSIKEGKEAAPATNEKGPRRGPSQHNLCTLRG